MVSPRGLSDRVHAKLGQTPPICHLRAEPPAEPLLLRDSASDEMDEVLAAIGIQLAICESGAQPVNETYTHIGELVAKGMAIIRARTDANRAGA